MKPEKFDERNKMLGFKDLEFFPHPYIPETKQAMMKFPDGTSVSVVGGDILSIHGDGVNDFEVWYSDEEDPRGWVSISSIDEEFAKRSNRFRGMI
jgi:hypothetical protein